MVASAIDVSGVLGWERRASGNTEMHSRGALSGGPRRRRENDHRRPKPHQRRVHVPPPAILPLSQRIGSLQRARPSARAFILTASNSSPLFQAGMEPALATRRPRRKASRASSTAPEKSKLSRYSSEGW